MRRILYLLCLVVFTLPTFAQSPATAPAKSAPPALASAGATGAIDKAYLQSICDGWASADLEKQGHFYAQGPGHLFFDVAPVKYTSWDEYKAGVAPSLKDAPKVTYTVNDDIQIHPADKVTWVDGTLDMSDNSPGGEKRNVTLRWTAIFEQQDGRWVIAHEHVSVAAEPPQQ